MSATDDTGRQSTDHTPRQMVDWGLALGTARRLVRPGPQVSLEEAREAVAELRELARVAEDHVRDYTGMRVERASSPVLVVDRYGWVQANADAFGRLMAPLTDRLRDRGRLDEHTVVTSVGARMTGLEAGALLAFLSGKVLGQFDPFWSVSPNGRVESNGSAPRQTSDEGEASSGDDAPSGEHRADGEHRPDGEITSRGESSTGGENDPVEEMSPGGRLLLVAPNIVQAERELEVDSRDFRLWVCLHEETHRVQFTAVPWLRAHLWDGIRGFLERADLDPSALAAQLRSGVEQMIRAARGDQDVSLIDIVQTPEQREILDRLTAVMSLLEGHADVVMDGVGPDVVPSVATIRERFQRRRSGGGWFDQVLKRVLGLDAKLRQYREGSAFVRGVVARVGNEGFNQVWAGPENLPTRTEITDPDAWVRRVLKAA